MLLPILLGMQKLNLKIHLSIKIGKSLGGYIWIIVTGVLRGPIVLADLEITPIEVFWGDGSGAQGEEPSVMRGDQGSERFFVLEWSQNTPKWRAPYNTPVPNPIY